MLKKSTIGLAALAALAATPAGAAEWEISGEVKNETSVLTQQGMYNGQAKSMKDNVTNDSLHMRKFENSLKLFVNGEFSDSTSLHGELNLIYDTEGEDGYRGYSRFSEHDYLRELYVDTAAGPFSFRIGKQQEVWGTADGIKLLDIVNPTDWREFTQNTMEDSRIPVWMAKAEMDIGETGNLQFLVAQNEENKIPGLEENSDQGHAFMMKGVESITGKTHGFLNLVPALGGVAGTFSSYGGGNLNGYYNTTVQNFVDNDARAGGPFGAGGAADFRAACGNHGLTNTATSAACLNDIAQRGNVGASFSGANQENTALIDGSNWNPNSPDTVFEYMNNATFATFDTFANARSEYRREYPEEWKPNIGTRYKNSIGDNFNFSVNYLWHYDPNPVVDLHWENAGGEQLDVSAGEESPGHTTVRLLNPTTGNRECSADAGQSPCTLVFTERLQRIHSFGTSFDTSIDSSLLGPTVLRGEFLYQTGGTQPVIDRTKLGYGDLVGGLKNEKADRFKYVLGADFIFLTNLTVSPQFIQFINLDYIDEAGKGYANSGRYSADPAVMHLSNNLKKDKEFKEFASLFLSKPFGEEQQGRVNNIFMIEEQGGFWNRIDMEYGFTDELIGTAELNLYFGNPDTMFGQFQKSSNAQLGLKYIF